MPVLKKHSLNGTLTYGLQPVSTRRYPTNMFGRNLLHQMHADAAPVFPEFTQLPLVETGGYHSRRTAEDRNSLTWPFQI